MVGSVVSIKPISQLTAPAMRKVKSSSGGNGGGSGQGDRSNDRSGQGGLGNKTYLKGWLNKSKGQKSEVKGPEKGILETTAVKWQRTTAAITGLRAMAPCVTSPPPRNCSP